jgi:hypothetical protein
MARRRSSGLAAAALGALLAASGASAQLTASPAGVGDPVRGATASPLPAVVKPAPVAAASPVVATPAPAAASPSPLTAYAPNKAVLSGTGPVYKKSDKLEPVRG